MILSDVQKKGENVDHGHEANISFPWYKTEFFCMRQSYMEIYINGSIFYAFQW
jgi:hypothetical protein